MGFPTDATTTKIVDKYQGVVIAEIACSLVLYIVLRIIHYCIWGHALQNKNDDEGTLILILRQARCRVRRTSMRFIINCRGGIRMAGIYTFPSSSLII